MKTLTGYHFTGDKLRNGEDIPAIGKWLVYNGDVVPCESGLHMSEHPFDALQYAPGNMLHRVELRGNLLPHGEPVDKWVGSQRKILDSINAEKLLRDFARWNALSVIHLWKAPDVVKKYLETGDESLRAAAWDAAWAAARDAARAAVWAAARDAAWAAARAAAWDAAWAAARAAARAAAIKKSREHFKEMVESAFNSTPAHNQRKEMTE